MKFLYILFLSLFALNLCTTQNLIVVDHAPATVEVFAPGSISTGERERDLAISGDGNEIYYTIQSPLNLFQTIVFIKKIGKDLWSEPEIVSFAGQYSDLEPALSHDGNKMYFSSNRPINGTELKDFDIWVVTKSDGKWGNPSNLGMPVNTEADEFYPSVTLSGNIYYTAAYKGGVGKEDIYCSELRNGNYSKPYCLDTMINSELYEFNAFVSQKEDVIVFTSYGRADDAGHGDLYMSRKDEKGLWEKAKNLKNINSDRIDYCPYISNDGKQFFFTSERNDLAPSFKKPVDLKTLRKLYSSPGNGQGDIYRIKFDSLLLNFDPKK